MKNSKYNILCEKNGKYYIFNTLTLAIAEIEKDNVVKLENNNFVSINQEDRTDLCENGFIVEDNNDEESELKNRFWQSTINNEELYISILTTLDCNLRCPYCFEHHNEEYLDQSVEQSIIDFIQNQASNLKLLKLDWYGGEPMMNLNSIQRISRKVIKICQENNIEYIASITTNGTFLNDESMDILEKNKIKYAQITIDGPMDVHDKRRIGKNGEGTYKTILNNIKKYKERINFIIRINVDSTNIDRIDDVLIEFVNNGFYGIPIAIKGIVSSEERKVKNIEISGEYLAKKIFEKYKLVNKLKLTPAIFQFFEASANRFCIIDSQNQYIVSPSGKLFKCGESYKNSDPGLVGSLENGNLKIKENKMRIWQKNPFEFQECKNCKIFPMCFGGCMMKRIVKKEQACNVDLKYCIRDYFLLYLNNILG